MTPPPPKMEITKTSPAPSSLSPEVINVVDDGGDEEYEVAPSPSVQTAAPTRVDHDHEVSNQDTMTTTKETSDTLLSKSNTTCYSHTNNSSGQVGPVPVLHAQDRASSDTPPQTGHSNSHLQNQHNSQHNSHTSPDSAHMHDHDHRRDSDDIEPTIQQILQIFPGLSIVHLHTMLQDLDHVPFPRRAEIVVEELFKMGSAYPKESQQKPSQQLLLQDWIINLQSCFALKDFLDYKGELIPAAQLYEDTSKPIQGRQKEIAIAALRIIFPAANLSLIYAAIEESHGHYFKAHHTVKNFLTHQTGSLLGSLKRKYNTRGKTGARKRRKTLDSVEDPDQAQPEVASLPDFERDDALCKEIWYAKNYDEIQNYAKEIRDTRALLIKMGKEENSLAECLCCFDDEVLFEDMVQCSEGHLICRDCIRHYVEEQIGSGKYGLPCINGNSVCQGEFRPDILTDIIDPTLLEKHQLRVAEHEINAANIPGLESCPFCAFSVVIDDDSNSIFKCENPKCGKDSCRKCRLESHIPLTCEENEKHDETAIRTFIENKMAEALIRRCKKCEKPFVKIDGCNKVICPCGQAMCYICGQILDKKNPYSHFSQTTACNLHSQDGDAERIKAAGMKALEDYKAKFPGVELKNNPLDEIIKNEMEKKDK